MKITDLLSILTLLSTIFVCGYAYTEYQKSVTGNDDIRHFEKGNVEKKSVEKSLTGGEEKCKLSFECMSKITE